METMQGLQCTKIALLIDFDNVILGVEDPGFDVELVVNALRSRGVVVMGRAYGDWYRHHRHRRKLMEQGIELVETPVFGPLIKNSADIRIVIDGLDIATAHAHIDTFCLVSGDSDFLPLIKRLQLLGKHVIVIAGVKFTSDLVRRNCNEYLAYENLLAESVGATEDASTLEGSFHLLEHAINTLNERGMDIRSSTVKQMMLQLNPAFSERTFGCYQFKQFLDKAARAGVVQLSERDGSAGEHGVLLSERSGQTSMREATARLSNIGNGANNGASETAPRDTNAAEKRPTTRGIRGRNRSQSAAEKAASSEPKTDAPANESNLFPEVPILALSSPTANGANAVAPISASALASRPGLRRGRLRFSAKSGASIARDASTTTEDALQSESSTRFGETLTDAAPVEQTLDVVQTPQDVLPAESILAQAVSDANSADANSEIGRETAENPSEDAAVATTKRRGSRGGKRRRGAKSGEVAGEDVAESASENAVDVAASPSENAAPAAVEAVATPRGKTPLETTPPEVINAAILGNDAEVVAPKKRAPRSRRSTKKPAAAVSDAPETSSE